MKTLALLALLCSPARAFWGHVHVGVSLPLSGEKADRGQMILRAAQMKVDDINAAGGVGGKPLDLIVRDDRNDPQAAIAIAQEFAASADVVAVIGSYDEEAAAKALPIYRDAKLPVFYPAIGNGQLTKSNPYAFSGTFGDDDAVETLGAFLKISKGYKTVLLLSGRSAYSRRVAGEFQRKAVRVGLTVREIEYPDGAVPEDFLAKKLTAADRGVDAVVIIAHINHGGPLIRQLRAANVKAPIFGGDRLASNLYETLGAKLTDDVHIAFPFLYDFAPIKGVEFKERFVKKHGVAPGVFAAFAYDGLGMIADAAARNGSREGVRSGLASHVSSSTAFVGITGRVYFDEDRTSVRDTVMGFLRKGQWKPCFDQLRKVTEEHTLSILDEKVKMGEVALADGVPFFKIKVIYAGIDYDRINQVNIKDLNFEAEFFLWFKWTGDVDLDGIGFVNEVAGKISRSKLRDNLDMVKTGHAAEKWASFRVKGTFLHPYELKLFPFDTQTLPLYLAHRTMNANKVMIVADSAEESIRPVDEIYPQEWNYLDRDDFAGTFNYESNFGNPNYSPGQTQADYSVYQSNIIIKRKLFPYMITLFMPLALLMATSMLGLMIPKEQFAPRNGLVMSALVGVLVYHMAQARSLPQVGYLMRSDLYFVLAYVLLFALVLALNVVNLLHTHHKESTAEIVDRDIRVIFPVIAIVAYSLLTASAFMF